MTTRPNTINTRPYFSPGVLLVKNWPGNEATVGPDQTLALEVQALRSKVEDLEL